MPQFNAHAQDQEREDEEKGVWERGVVRHTWLCRKWRHAEGFVYTSPLFAYGYQNLLCTGAIGELQVFQVSLLEVEGDTPAGSRKYQLLLRALQTSNPCRQGRSGGRGVLLFQ